MESRNDPLPKTDELLRKLSFDLKSFTPWTTTTVNLVGSVVMLLISASFFLLLPTREGLSSVMVNLQFWIDTFIWLLISVLSFNAFVKRSMADISPSREFLIITAFTVILIVSALAQTESSGLQQQLVHEMDWYKGRCGPIIFVTSIISSLCLGILTKKKLAPFNAKKTAFWIGLTSGTSATFLMQFICAHEQILHVFIWHMLPIGLFCGLSAVVGQKIYRW